MNDKDKKPFMTDTYALYASLNQPVPDIKIIADWYHQLKEYDLKAIVKAYNEVVDERAMPTIENVRKWLKPLKNTVADTTKQISTSIKFEAKPDSKNWARKILADPNYKTQIGIKYAKIALNFNNDEKLD